MFGINKQQTVVPVQSSKKHVGIRTKHAMKKSMKPKNLNYQVPVTAGRKHILKKHRTVVGQPSLFQRIRLAIMSRLAWSKKMITGTTVAPSKAHVGVRSKHAMKKSMKL
jgi:hypothetical protein